LGKNGIKKKKIEGDKSTPSGVYSFEKLYYRSDRVPKPVCKIPVIKIKENMGWCDDPNDQNYNKQIIINNTIRCEKLFRKDNLYNYILIISYNTKRIIPFKGSAVFLHLTKNYKKTLGCIAIKEKDFSILCKLINKKTKIKIS